MDASLDGYIDAFVVKLSHAGDALLYATFLGGASGQDYGIAIAVDQEGNAYVAGSTNSVDFPTTPGPGDVVFSELMIVPPTGPDGEWIELANASETTWTLEGCELTSGDGETWTFAGGAPGAHLLRGLAQHVLVRSPDPALNGAINYDHVVESIALGNDGDLLVLSCGDTVVDSVGWGPGWSIPIAAPLSLSGNRVASADNDEPHHWCDADAAGTPGAANPLCPPLDPSVDVCVLLGPLDAEVLAGEVLSVSALVYDAGTTDATAVVDAAPGLLGQVGYGPSLGSPEGPDWVWIDAAGDDDWVDTSNPGSDRWIGPLMVEETGTFDVAFRFSADNGSTWQVCDADGSGNGYDAAQSGTMTVLPSPCVPNPCGEPAAAYCAEDTMVVEVGMGVCAPDGPDDFDCSFDQEEFDCSPFGGCMGGECKTQLQLPSAPGALIITEVMRDSADEEPDDGEWVELLNPTSNPIDLRGCTLGDAHDDAYLVESVLPVVVAPSEYIVLAGNPDTATNGGLAPAHVWDDGFRMSNLTDEVRLVCGGTVIDEVGWGIGWPGESGVAMQLDPGVLKASDNDGAESWCNAKTMYGDGSNLGTPGKPNLDCPTN